MNSPPDSTTPTKTTETIVVSVVIPCYNRGRFLRRSVRSVLAQSFGDFELIVIDDASDDDLRAVIAEFPDPRIRFLRLPSRGGANRARNTGIKAARGEWIAFLDSDDEWRPHRLELQVREIQAGSGDVEVAYCRTQRIDETTGRRSFLKDGSPVGDVFRHLFEGNKPCTSALMIRRRTLLDAGGFDESLPCGQETDLMRRLAMGGARFSALAEVLTVHHIHADPRISIDPESRWRGLGAVDRKWSHEIRARLGTYRYRRWKIVRHQRVQALLRREARREFKRGDLRRGARHSFRALRSVIQILPTRAVFFFQKRLRKPHPGSAAGGRAGD